MARSSTSRARPAGDKLRGELAAWRSVRDGWGFGELKTTQTGGYVKVTGTLIGAKVGSALELTGHYTTHPTYGPQFKFTSAEVIVPQDASGVVSWLASELPQISRRRAEELVAHHGVEGVWKVLDTRDAASLTRVDGITIERANQIFDAYELVKSERDRMVTLKQFGLTDNQIARVLKEWGKSAIERITENPYSLSDFIDGFGWTRADAVAMKMGLPKDSPARLRAGLFHVLGEAKGQGNMYCPGGMLVRKVAEAKMCDVAEQKVRDVLEGLVVSAELVRRGTGIFLRELDGREQSLADCFAARVLAMKGEGQ
jgi:exodeoxyribonuclease V alpha subunit